MSKVQIMHFLTRLKNPSTILSVVSQAAAILLLLGIHIDQSLVMTIAAAVCSLLVTLGILSNPDTVNNGFGDDIHVCASCNKPQKHVLVNGQLVCQHCGTPQPA